MKSLTHYKTYNIHDLISVNINKDLRKEVLMEIDFQLSDFYVDKGVKNKYQIWINPLKDTDLHTKKNEEVSFYDLGGAVNKYLVFDDQRLVIFRNRKHIHIYSDLSNYLINVFIQIFLIEQNLTMIHAGGFSKTNGKVTLLAGAGGVGKTTILSYAIKNLKYKTLGDDILIVGRKKICLSFLRKFILKSYHIESHADIFKKFKIPKWNLSPVKKFIINNAPFVSLLKTILKNGGVYYQITKFVRPQPYLGAVSCKEAFGINSTIKSGNIEKIVFLERSANKNIYMKKVSSQYMANRLISIIHFEFKEYLTQFLSIASLNIVDLNLYFKKNSKIVNEITNSKNFYISVPENLPPDKLIDFLKEKNIL